MNSAPHSAVSALALAFQRRLRLQDFVRQALGQAGARRRCRSWEFCRQRRGALGAELRARRRLAGTGRTSPRKGAGALDAELGARPGSRGGIADTAWVGACLSKQRGPLCGMVRHSPRMGAREPGTVDASDIDFNGTLHRRSVEETREVHATLRDAGHLEGAALSAPGEVRWGERKRSCEVPLPLRWRSAALHAGR